MRVFLLISKQGDAWPLLQRIEEEGHHAIVYINEDDNRRVGNGLVEKSSVQEVLIDENGTVNERVLNQVLHPKPDCIIFDMVGKGYGKLADGLRKKGFPVIGGSAWGDAVELDRPYGSKVMRLMGIDAPKTYTFTDYQEAIRFVEQSNKPYVYKPSGNQPTSTTYVSKGPDDLIGMLEFYSDIKEEFELQEKVDGIEVSTELWFNGKEVLNVNHTMEEKTLMDGGVGPKTGSMGSVVWIGSKGSRLYEEGLGKITPALKKSGYIGPVDLNTIVTKDRLYGLEFTCRFGYDAIFCLRELYRGKINDLLYGFASGAIKDVEVREEWALGVVFCVLPYPLPEESDYSKDVLIQGFNKGKLKHTWFYDVYKKGEALACAGNGGNLGAVTARGETVREARRRAYRTLNGVIIPDVMYRRDIGERVPNDYAQLKNWGWI